MFEQEARERQLSKLKQFNDTDRATIPQRSEGKSRDQVSKLFNINPRYISDIKKIDKEYSDLVPKKKTGELKN